MKRAFYFSVAAAAVLGFATSAWAQAAGGTGGAGGAGGTAGAGASGSAGAGASGSAGVGAAGTGGVGGNAGTTGQAGAGVAGATNGVGASNGLGANNGVNTNNNAVNTGVTNRSGFGNTGTSGRTNANTGGAGSNLNPNAGFNGFNGGISQNPFFSNQAVRQQLRMNDAQFNSLNRAYQDAYTNYQNSLNGLGKNLTADQRTQQMEMLQNQFNDRFNQNVNSTLTDPGARSRFEQLNRQYMGLSNFNNPAIQKQLNLTPQQLNQIRQLSTSIRSQESNANPSLNQSQLYSQTWDQLNSILTPQQQQTWSQLTGERFDFGGTANINGAAQGTTGTGFPGTGGTSNGNANATRSPDPSNNLTAPRNGSGNVPFGTSPGTETNGTGTNSGNTSGTNGSSTTGGTGGTTGTSGSTSGTGTGTGGNTGSTTGNSSSK
jgi:hypothetical protein